MVTTEYLNDRETIVLKELEEKQRCVYSRQEIEVGEFAVGFDYDGYESRAVWVEIESVSDFSEAVNEFLRTDGKNVDGLTGILVGRSNKPVTCDICGDSIEDTEFASIEDKDPRYCMRIHKNKECINKFQKDLQSLKKKMYLILPDKI